MKYLVNMIKKATINITALDESQIKIITENED